jgi:PAS domain S-box-containing protein
VLVSAKAIRANCVIVTKNRYRSVPQLFLSHAFYRHGKICSKTQHWIKLNDRLCEILGYTRNELEHKKCAEIIHPENRERHDIEFQQILNGASDAYVMDKRYIRKDGTIVFVKVNVKCLRKADGNPDVIIATIQDISEQKKSKRKCIVICSFLLPRSSVIKRLFDVIRK